jgi:cell division protease FtsH
MVTTGASNDIQQVANIAKRMVKEWGMSDKVGHIVLNDQYGRGPMRMSMQQRIWGNKILGDVEQEVERLVNNSYLIAKHILQSNRNLLDHLAATLIEQEVVSAEEFQMMLVKFNAQTIDYKVIGQERKRETLPFQFMPTSI